MSDEFWEAMSKYNILLRISVYPPFMGVVSSCGRRLEDVPLVNTDGEYTIDFGAFEKAAAQPENKLLLLCSPPQPRGQSVDGRRA